MKAQRPNRPFASSNSVIFRGLARMRTVARAAMFHRGPAMAVVAYLTSATQAAAFTQNTELEAALNRSDPTALMLFPAKGHRDGAAGFFRERGLQIVPNSERAWCQEQRRGALERGCYVEWFYHYRGYNQRTWDGEPCGYLARWYKAPGTDAYVPTAGSPFADAIARGDVSMLELEDTLWTPVRLRDVQRLTWCTTISGRQ